MFRGGYLGVDIFLVVSGFLICTSILNSLALPNHQFSLIHFYKRRFYRLSLPLIPLILFCAVLGYFVLVPNIFHELLSETARALTFISNQYFAKQGGYFALNSLDKILLHTWYLSLIGQFYIVFPLVVLLINKLLGQKYLKTTIFALTIFTFVYAEQKFILTRADNIYYLSAMRAWELLFGASLAFINVNLNHKKLWFYIGVSLLTAQIIFTEDQNYNPLAILFVILATSLVIIANYQDSRLNNRVVQFLGKSSYSLYLWHWPIMVFCSRLAIFEATWFVVTLILATWLLSYRFEKLDKKYFLVVATLYSLLGATTLGLLALNKMGAIDLQYKNAKTVKDLEEHFKIFPGFAEIHENIKDKTKPINTLIIGDSNACHYLEYFTKELNLKYVELNASIKYGKNVSGSLTSNEQYLDLFYKNVIQALSQMPNGSRVIIANRWQFYVEEFQSRNDSILKVSQKYQDDVLGGIIADLGQLTDNFHYLKFYIISQPVRPSVPELVPIISKYYLGAKYSYSKKIREFLGFSLNESFHPSNIICAQKINSILKSFSDKHENVYFIDRNIPVCKNKHDCLLVIDDKPLYSDIDHLSFYGGTFVGKYILKKINDTDL